MKISNSALPDILQRQFQICIDSENQEGYYPPEFWIAITTDKQEILIAELEKQGLEYIIYEITDSIPPKSIAVCRCRSYRDTELAIIETCKTLLIDDFVVSDGGLSSVDVNGDLQGFICFD